MEAMCAWRRMRYHPQVQLHDTWRSYRCYLTKKEVDRVNELKKIWKGILLCLAIAVPAYLLGNAVPLAGGPVIAILLGMALSAPCKRIAGIGPGLSFASKKVLQAAVVLLGFGMNLSEILAQGRQSLPIIIVTIAVALAAAFVLCRALRIPGKVGTLIGVGSAICGGSAIAATASVIDADEEEVAQAISVIFLFNIAAALLFPALGRLLGLSNESFALFAGTAINDTSSVTAAASAWDGIYHANVLQMATVVKLTRTLFIIPITLCLALHRARKSGGTSLASIKKGFPFFVIFFVLASVFTTVVGLPATITVPLKNLSKFCIVVAMAAIGLNTNLPKLLRTGGRSVLMGLSCWVIIAVTSLLMLLAAG